MLRNKAAVLRSCAAFALLQVLLICCWKQTFYFILSQVILLAIAMYVTESLSIFSSNPVTHLIFWSWQLQFTMPGGRHAMHHISLLQKAGAGRVLRTIAASATAPLQAKVFARVVLRNVELHPAGEHTTSS
jgi:hypothetical protein